MEPLAIAPEGRGPDDERVPDAVRPPPGNPRFPAFDGLRACAALAIVAGHAAFVSGYTVQGTFGPWMANLYVGVTVFFVISGFLLYRPFVAADLGHRTPPATLRFFRRRLLRIVPAYWLALTIVGLIPGLAPNLFEHWPKYYFFLQIYTPSPDGIGPAWSLCVEMSFYLLLPFYALATRRLLGDAAPGRRLRIELLVLGVVALLSIIDHEVWVLTDAAVPSVFGALPQFLFWFALGMGLAVVSAWAHAIGFTVPALARIGRRPGQVWIAALGAFVLLGALTRVPPDGVSWSHREQTLQYLFEAVIGFLFVLPAIFPAAAGRQGVPARFLTARPVAWLGLISYGIYLWHVPVMSFAVNHLWVGDEYPSVRFLEYLGIGLAITIPIAAASYYLVERPVLRFKEPRAPAAPRRAVPPGLPSAGRWWNVVLVAVALACGLYAYVQTSGSGFLSDDFENLGLAADGGLSWDFLVKPVAALHLAPGHRFLDWLIVALPGLPDWHVVSALCAGLLAVAVCLLGHLVRVITRAPWVSIGVAAVFGTSIVWVRIGMWWANAAHVLPATVLVLGMLLLALHWDRTRSNALLGVIAGMFVLALAFYAKAALGALLVVLLLVVARPETRAFMWSPFRRRVIETFPLTLALLAVAVVWGVLTLVAPGTAEAPQPRSGDWIPLLRGWWTDGFGDIAVNVRPGPAAPQAWGVAGIILLVALAAATTRGSRAALLWLGVPVVLAVSAVLVGLERLGEFGPLLATELRYHPEDLLTLAVLGPAAWTASGRPKPTGTPQRVGVLAAVLTCATLWVVQGVNSASAIRDAEPAVAARAWLDQLHGSLRPGDRPLTVLDDRAPDSVVSRTLGPYSALSRIIPIFVAERGVAVDTGSGALRVVDPSGAARAPVLGPVHEVVQRGDACLRSAPGSRFLDPGLPTTSMALPRSTEAQVLTIQLAQTSASGTLALYETARPTGLPKELSIDRGARLVRTRVPRGVTAVSLQAWGGLATCLTRATTRTLT